MTKRIGMIVVDSNAGSETDFWSGSPEGVTTHVARMKMRPSVRHDLHEPADMDLFRRELKEEAEKLSQVSDVLVYQRTYSTHVNHQAVREVMGTFGKPYVIAEWSAIELLKEIGATNLWVFTPYGVERTEEEVKFLGRHLNVAGYTYLGLNNGLEYSNVKHHEIVHALMKENINADAVYIHCTNLTTHKAIAELRKGLKIPVISENSASLTMALRELGEGKTP